jgi:hypothetical protein
VKEGTLIRAGRREKEISPWPSISKQAIEVAEEKEEAAQIHTSKSKPVFKSDLCKFVKRLMFFPWSEKSR